MKYNGTLHPATPRGETTNKDVQERDKVLKDIFNDKSLHDRVLEEEAEEEAMKIREDKIVGMVEEAEEEYVRRPLSDIQSQAFNSLFSAYEKEDSIEEYDIDRDHRNIHGQAHYV